MTYKVNYRLGDLFRSRRERGSAGLPLLSVTVNHGLVDRGSSDLKIGSNLTDEAHLLVRKGDISYNTMRMWQGASGLAEKDGLVSPAYVVLAPKKNIDTRYASQLFKSRRMIHLFWAYSYGLTSDRLRLYYGDFARIPVAIPPVKDQSKIAEILDAWDRSIEAVESLIVNHQTLKAVFVQKLFQRSFPRIGEKKEWKLRKLKDLFSQRSEVGSESLPLLSITRHDGVIAREDLGRKDTSNDDKRKYRRIRPGDIGYNTMRMWQGVSALSSRDGLVSPAYTVVTPKASVSGRFMAHLFKHPRTIHDFYRFSQGLVSDTWNLKYRHFKEIKVRIPDFTEQESIADTLDAFDSILSSLEARRSLLHEEKKSLQQQLLTGKRRVMPGSAT